jgi:hypothetical protein
MSAGRITKGQHALIVPTIVSQISALPRVAIESWAWKHFLEYRSDGVGRRRILVLLVHLPDFVALFGRSTEQRS